MEGFEWSADKRPIGWKTLGEAQALELSLFRHFRDLDKGHQRRVNISVHKSRTGPNDYDLFFFLRDASGGPAVYPLKLDLSSQEITQALAKVRSTLKTLVENTQFSGFSSREAEYSGSYHSAAEGAGPDEAIAYSLSQKLLQDMALVGHALWGRLFGSEQGHLMASRLAAALKEDGATIQVWIAKGAEDFILPWVWLHPSDDAYNAQGINEREFWGYRYVVEQVRDRPGKTRPSSTIPAHPLLVSGALHGFTNASRQRMFFDSYRQRYPEFGWKELPPDDVNAALRGFQSNILYFFCHGHTEKTLDPAYLETLEAWGRHAAARDDEDATLMLEFVNLQRRKKIRDHSYIQIENVMLKMDDLRQFKPATPNLAPLIFLNMCESAEFYPGANDNLVDVFLDRGAGGVVGTEMPMLTVFGDLMARRFFELYLGADSAQDGSEGRTIGRVFWQLRREFLDQGNPLAFAYTYYGDATTRLNPAVAKDISSTRSKGAI